MATVVLGAVDVVAAVALSEPAAVSVAVSEPVVVGVAAVAAAVVEVASVVAGSALVVGAIVVGGATVSGTAEGSSGAGSALSPESPPQAAASRASTTARPAASAKPGRRVRVPVLLRWVRAIGLTLAAAELQHRPARSPPSRSVSPGPELASGGCRFGRSGLPVRTDLAARRQNQRSLRPSLCRGRSVRQELAVFCTDGVLIAASSDRGSAHRRSRCGRARNWQCLARMACVLLPVRSASCGSRDLSWRESGKMAAAA